MQLYLEGNGFRRIERILKVSHVSVITWVKKAGAKLEKVPEKDGKVEVLEPDELFINKKTSASGPQYIALQSGLLAFKSEFEKQNTFKNS